MRKKFINDLFEINLPNSWDFDESEHVLSLYDPINGKGALQISSYWVEGNCKIDLKSELAEFVISHFEESIEESEIISEISEKNGYSFFEFDTNSDHWIFLIFLKKNLILFISYNCELEDKNVEDKGIWDILSSMEITS